MEFRDFTIAIYNLSEYAYLLVGIYALWKSWKTQSYWWLSIFLLSVGTIRTVSIFMANAEMNTMYLYHIIGFLELLFAFQIYRTKIAKQWSIITVVFLTLYLINSLFVTSIFEANNIGWALVQLMILLFGCNYLFFLYKTTSESNLDRSPLFYFNAGFMLYAAGSFFVNLLSSEIVSASTNDFFNNAWIIDATVALLRLLFFFLGFYFVKRER